MRCSMTDICRYDGIVFGVEAVQEIDLDEVVETISNHL